MKWKVGEKCSWCVDLSIFLGLAINHSVSINVETFWIQRLSDEREAKLKSITANISASMAKATPGSYCTCM